jgi:hypothetical protein
VQAALINARFEGTSGLDVDVTRCPLMTQSEGAVASSCD